MGDSPSRRWRDVSELFLRDIFAERFRIQAARVDGVEVTQSIQLYDAGEHLTDPADRGPDNAVRLVASKPAWVRVYVRTNRVSDLAGVTGTLEVERRFNGFSWSTVATLGPQPPGSVIARQTRDYALERSTITETLNFVVPADEFWGNLRLTVRITDGGGTEYDSETRLIDATLRQTLRIRAIMVSYSGPATAMAPPPGGSPVPTVTLAAPTLADLQATAGLSLRAMPVQSQGDFTSAGSVAWNLPLDDPRSCPGCCSANWDALLAVLGTQRTNDGNRTDLVYYGLLPVGIPLGVPGCGSGGLGSAAAGNQPTLMHEIGHGYDFQHTPCGAGGTPDPNYPTYEPYPAASIGEYGLDIADGSIMSPAGTFDYMSYCGPRWMSRYQHDRLILHSRLGQEWLRDDLIWDRYVEWREYYKPRDLPYPAPDPYHWDEMRFDPVIAISGLVEGPELVDVRSVARVAAAGFPPGAKSTLTARLVGDNGETLAEGVVRRLDTHADGGSCCGHDDVPEPTRYAFEVYVPDVSRGAALVIEDGERRIWERRAPASPPSIGEVDVRVLDESRLAVSWDPDHECELGDAWVQWSGDDGATWRALATGVRGGGATFELTGVPAGPALVRVLLHDGFATAASDPVAVEIPAREPDVAILHPEPGALLAAGGTLRAWASVTDAGGEPLRVPWCRWLLDGREVGQGTDAWLVAPEPGEHRLTLLVRDGKREIQRDVTFTCRPGPSQDRSTRPC